MCGITGFSVHLDSYTTTMQIERMTSLLNHRGPDAQGVFVDEQIALGARRLSIMDVEHGNQPVFNETEEIVAVMNGEIYNDQYLRELLRARGHQLNTTCDTELLPHLYEEFGLECVQMLDGMFAFALWDSKLSRLIISSDQVGIKPIYYTVTENRNIVFASELKALRSVVTNALRIDPVSIAEYLKFKAIPAPYTPYQEVYKMLPGETLIWQDGQLEHRFFKSVPPEKSPTNLEAVLHESVRTTMRSDVEVASVVSGGLDSSFVLSSMAKYHPSRVHAFAVGYPGELHDDETKYAERITSEVSGLFHRVSVDPQDIPNLLPRVIWQMDEPNQDPITIPFYVLMRSIRDSHAVVLTGDGADELFGGYSRFRHWMSEQNENALHEYLRELQVFSEEDLQNLLLPQHREQMLQLRDSSLQLQEISNLKDAMKWERTYRLPAYHLMRVDKLSMAFGIEARVPFLRSAVVDAAVALRENDLLHEGVEKVALRQATANDLPVWLMNRKKKPFTFPISDWLRYELREWMYSTLLSSNSILQNWINREIVADLLNQHVEGTVDHSSKIWSLLVLETFLQQL